MPASSRPVTRLTTSIAGLGAVACAIGCHARYVEPREPVLERFEIMPVSALSHRPLSVGFVTDTHVGPTVSANDVERATRLLIDASPDIVLFGGDFICESPRYIPDAAAAIGDCAALGKYGALAVLGNHDYSNDAPRLVAALERRGVRVLRNESAAVGPDGEQIWIAGVDDAVLGNPDLAAAFDAVPAGAPAVALWHEPDWAEQSARYGAFLQLSGHSHGGQVRLPWLGPLAAPTGGKRFTAGPYWVNRMCVYTSRGVGAYRPPVRFRCRPEVTMVQVGP